jgi:hypothetical protein
MPRFPGAAPAREVPDDPAPPAEARSSPRSFRGAHCIALSLGLLTDLTGEASLTQGGTTVRGDAEGLLLSLEYSYGLTPELAAGLGVGLLDADATVGTTGTTATVESAAVTAVMFGVKYRPEGLVRNPAFRPYASGAVGPVVGSGTFVQAGPVTAAGTYSETAFGARIAIGADVLLGRRFALGLGAGYRFVADFDRRVGSRVDYSSPEASMSIGVLFGGG